MALGGQIMNMKQYDRETRTWILSEEVDKKLTKRKLCKGGREHDWVLCLPSYVHHEGSVLGLDIVEKYYAIEDAREDSEIAFDEQLEALGIKARFSLKRTFGRRRHHICSVCLKRS